MWLRKKTQNVPITCTVQFSHSVMSDSLRPHEPQHARPCCPPPTPRVYSNSCPLSRWCHPTISSSVVPFSCLRFFPASRSFPVSQFLASGGQSIGVSASASVLPMSIQDWFPLGLTCFALVCSLHRTAAHQWRRWGKALLLRWWLSVQRWHKNQSAY